jgi:hypothetical protein
MKSRIGVAALKCRFQMDQFQGRPSPRVDHAFDRFGRDRLTGHLRHHHARHVESPRVGRGHHDPRDQQRRQFPPVNPQQFPCESLRSSQPPPAV